RDGLANAAGGSGNQRDLAFDFVGNAVLEIGHEILLGYEPGETFTGPALVKRCRIHCRATTGYAAFAALRGLSGFCEQMSNCQFAISAWRQLAAARQLSWSA